MREVYCIFKRELLVFYRSAGSYILYILFLLVSSLWLYRVDNFLVRDRADFVDYFAVIPYILAVIIPAMTMGVWAEEKNRGTYELLLTQRTGISRIVSGKFAAAFVQTLVMIVLTFPIPLSLKSLGSFDTGRIAVQYTGILLFSSSLISLGLFISAWYRRQIYSFILTILIFLILVMPWAVLRGAAAGGIGAGFIREISPWYHLSGFSKGIIDSRDLSYYLLTTFLFLFLNVRKISMEKWS